MEDTRDLRELYRTIDRDVKHILDEIKYIKGLYLDVDARGNKHANDIEAVKQNTERILKRLDEHHEALFKPPESIYLKIDRLEEFQKRTEEQSANKWPLFFGAAGFVISVLTFFLLYVIKK